MSTSTESTAPGGQEQQVTAGEYEVVAVNLDVITSKRGEPFDFVRYVRGNLVHLDVAEARRHLGAGSVVVPGSRELAAAQATKAAYEAALAALSPAQRAALGEDVVERAVRRRRPRAVPSTPPGDPAPAAEDDDDDEGGPTADEQDDDSVDDGGPTGDPSAPERPKRAESKASWLSYVVAKGYLTEEAAEAMSKDDIVATVYGREGGS